MSFKNCSFCVFQRKVFSFKWKREEMNSLVACIIRDSNGVVACVARDEEVEKISKKLSGKADFDKPTFDEPVCYVAKNYLFVYHVAHGICYW